MSYTEYTTLWLIPAITFGLICLIHIFEWLHLVKLRFNQWVAKSALQTSQESLDSAVHDLNRLNKTYDEVLDRGWKLAFQRFVALDVETTGLSRASSRIIQIGLVLFDNGKAVGQKQWYVNPGVRIPPSSTKVNKITNDMVQWSPTLKQLAPEATPILERYPVVGHNIKFDIDILESDFRRSGIDLHLTPGCCTMRWLFGNDIRRDISVDNLAKRNRRRAKSARHKWLKLSDLARLCEVAPKGNFHDALIDARTAGECFIRCAEGHTHNLRDAVDRARQQVSEKENERDNSLEVYEGYKNILAKEIRRASPITRIAVRILSVF